MIYVRLAFSLALCCFLRLTRAFKQCIGVSLLDNYRKFITWPILIFVGRHSSVGIVTRYGLDGPGIESRWGGRDFLNPSRPALGPTQPPVQWGPGFFPGVKVVGGVELATPPPLALRLTIG
jgi:hypothetical protein